MALYGRPAQVLVVEDNPTDAELAAEALATHAASTSVTLVRDGREALTYLGGAGGDEPASVPDLVLLDLNLPRVHGFDVLAFIRSDASLRSVPVVVLSSSTDADDIRRSYAASANCYIAKPADIDDFLEVVQSIARFWLGVARLPTRP
jgi:two-component system, chemotaxis family, response regulator Rcp1